MHDLMYQKSLNCMKIMRERSALEVLLAFLKLGVTSFGGPVAHLGYFRAEFVERRRWLTDAAYSDLVALCQFLPGPTSSQVGFSVGLSRAGYAGALAAWLGFTLPSAILMTSFAYGADALRGPVGSGLLHGLQLVAVAIVAQAVWGMARALCPDVERKCIALIAALIMLSSTSSIAQIGAISLGAIAGLWLCTSPSMRSAGTLGIAVSRVVGVIALASFVLLLVVLPLVGKAHPSVQFFDAFYRSGALVFGGGHVVLPLLSHAAVAPGWVSETSLLAGYGAAQAVPGPLFTFAAYLGALDASSPSGAAGASLAIIAIFLPGMLLLLGVLPFWDVLRQRGGAQAAMRGTNAAVVGLLAAALYNPLWITSIKSSPDFGFALVGFLLLVVGRAPPLLVVILGAAAGRLMGP
jgi:chromate transporter